VGANAGLDALEERNISFLAVVRFPAGKGNLIFSQK
jgi:hypothetical protein